MQSELTTVRCSCARRRAVEQCCAVELGWGPAQPYTGVDLEPALVPSQVPGGASPRAQGSQSPSPAGPVSLLGETGCSRQPGRGCFTAGVCLFSHLQPGCWRRADPFLSSLLCTRHRAGGPAMSALSHLASHVCRGVAAFALPASRGAGADAPSGQGNLTCLVAQLVSTAAVQGLFLDHEPAPPQPSLWFHWHDTQRSPPVRGGTGGKAGAASVHWGAHEPATSCCIRVRLLSSCRAGLAACQLSRVSPQPCGEGRHPWLLALEHVAVMFLPCQGGQRCDASDAVCS